jgi:DNA-directed RNA polymerase subunit beta
MDIQLKFFQDFLQEDIPPSERKSVGLQDVFESVFPITDSRGNYELQFVEYYLDKPKYSFANARKEE